MTTKCLFIFQVFSQSDTQIYVTVIFCTVDSCIGIRLVPIKMKSMVMTSYVLAIIIWSILAQTNPSKLSIILKFVNKNISTNHQRGKLSTNQGRPFIFADICCCFEKKISTILSTTELKALFSRYRWEFRYLN